MIEVDAGNRGCRSDHSSPAKWVEMTLDELNDYQAAFPDDDLEITRITGRYRVKLARDPEDFGWLTHTA